MCYNKANIIMRNNLNQASGFGAVLCALIGNSTITIFKFAGFLISGSSSLFSESMHSLADSLNQALLMVGIKKSTKQADEKYAYGYGQERFLWALISACGIFFIGAVVTIYHGVSSLLYEAKIELGPMIFLILAASFVIESLTLLKAARDLKIGNKGLTFKEALKEGDPTIVSVIYEDTIAVLGVIIALASIALSYFTKNYFWDAAGSILIGVMLGIVAVTLVNKNRKYLIKKSIPDECKEMIIEMLNAEPYIDKVLDFKSSVLDINKFRIKCEVEFNGAFLLSEIMEQDDLREEFENIKEDYEEYKKFLVYYADRITRLVGKKIDEAEKKIKIKFPNVIHIDIELN